jgi:hypothetical protein
MPAPPISGPVPVSSSAGLAIRGRRAPPRFVVFAACDLVRFAIVLLCVSRLCKPKTSYQSADPFGIALAPFMGAGALRCTICCPCLLHRCRVRAGFTVQGDDHGRTK